MSIFTSVKVPKPRRTKKNLSFNNLITARFGALTPILCKEVYPNETWKEKPTVLCRMTPLIVPLMSKMEIRVDYFFVPNRILWTEWEEFITRGLEGTTEVNKPVVPLSELHPFNGSLADYLNFPTVPYSDDPDFPVDFRELVDCLPFAAYRKIWEDWYCDENLQTDEIHEWPMITNELKAHFNDMAPQYIKFHKLLSRGWKKDYFTSALPWAQRGPELSLDVDIFGNGGQIGTTSFNTNYNSSVRGSTQPNGEGDGVVLPSGRNVTYVDKTDTPSGYWGHETMLDGQDNPIYLSHFHNVQDKPVNSTEGKITGLEGEGFTVNEFRRLVAIQEWFETNARAGGRYIESLLAHFGSRVPDYRLDRSEYIGGLTNEFAFGEVLQTSSNDSTTGQALGAYAGRGVSLVQGKIKKYHVPEHGWLLGLLSIRPKRNAYYQGIPRQYSRRTALEYMFPKFANLGEQSIKNKEIYAFGDGTTKDDDFGYTPRFAELYQSMDEIHGEMRNTLDYWHTARKFDSLPTLSDELVDIMESRAQLNRIFAFDDPSTFEFEDSSNDHFILEVYQDIRAKRCLPVTPIPSIR